MKILVVGGGGREHALAWKLAQSPRVETIFCAPGNPGTAALADNVNIAAEDVSRIVDFARRESIDLTVVGPEDPLAMGLVDRLNEAGLRGFGPSAAAAKIESDKAYAKQIMRKYSIPTAEARIFDKFEAASEYVLSRDEPLVVKAAGLAKGKGVAVCDNPSEALLAVEEIMVGRIHGDAGAQVVIEERLKGPEATLLAFVDGRNIYVMESSQDHKPVGEGDTGPNTGGMGAYSPAPIIDQETLARINREILVPTVDAMARERRPYKGVLYVGLMLTDQGPRVIEFNCRFGDPEAQAVLMRMRSDLVEPMEAAIDGRLDEITIRWDPRPALCVVAASGGYPGSYEKGKTITGVQEAETEKDVAVFHAGTSIADDRLITSGGRVLGITALGDGLANAKHRAYEAAAKIAFEGIYFRKDIGDQALASSST
jgi:phosphoribosylamine--glycine ligase